MKARRKTRVRIPPKKTFGRGFLTPGALLLLAMTGYEAWVRWDDLMAFFSSVRYFSEKRGESFLENLPLFLEAPGMQTLLWKMLFLIACILLAIITLCLRNRPLAAIGIFSGTTGVFAFGCFVAGMLRLDFGSLLQVLKLIPLLLILAGCVMNLAQYGAARRRIKKPKTPAILTGAAPNLSAAPHSFALKKEPGPYFERNKDSEYWKDKH